MEKFTQRPLDFGSIDEILPEVERLCSGRVEASGSFSCGQILEHLARALEIATGDRQPPPVMLPIRLAMRVMRPLILSRPFKPGLKLPPNAQSAFWPDGEVEVAEGLQRIRQALARFQATDPLPKHLLFGNLTRAQHERVQCLHCALHLSLVHRID